MRDSRRGEHLGSVHTNLTAPVAPKYSKYERGGLLRIRNKNPSVKESTHGVLIRAEVRPIKNIKK